MSLRALLNRDEVKGVEIYKMLDTTNDKTNNQILLVKRINITFENQECLMLNFTNITTLRKLQKE